MSEEKEWIWLIGQVPAFSGQADCVFQAKAGSLEQLGDRITIRRLTKLIYEGHPKQGNFKAVPMPWIPFMFEAGVNDDTEMILRQEAILFVAEISEDSPFAKDALKAWIPEAITPADAGVMKAEVHKFETRKRIIE